MFNLDRIKLSCSLEHNTIYTLLVLFFSSVLTLLAVFLIAFLTYFSLLCLRYKVYQFVL